MRWLYRAKGLYRVFELKEEMAVFLCDNHNSDDANYVNREDFSETGLFDSFKNLSNLNKSVQGP
jgi:hypothetical protein